MKTSASPGAISRGNLRLPRPSRNAGIAERIHRSCIRIWLRYRLNACQRSLHAIAAQRENDFHAERLLHRDISAMRSRLQSL